MAESMTLSEFNIQLDALVDHRRRRPLVELLETPQVGTPLEQVADGGREIAKVDPDVAMTHVHLPKLAASGYITWDRGNDTVARGPGFGRIEPLLAVLEQYCEGLLLEDDV